MFIPRFNEADATKGEITELSRLRLLPDTRLADLALGHTFQPGQFVGSDRLRLDTGGLARRLLYERVPEEVDALIQRARETRNQTRAALFPEIKDLLTAV